MNPRSNLLLCALFVFCLGSTADLRNATAQAESKANLKLPKFKSLNSFADFAPKNADLLVVLRPRQLSESPIFQSAMENPAPLPLDPSRIELIMVATNWDTLKVFHLQQQNAFARIAAQLSDDPEEQASIKSMEQFEQDFSVLVRFTRPTPWKSVVELMPSLPGETLKPKKWRGLQVLSREGQEPCTIRVDERTFLLCDRQKLATALENQESSNQVLTWLSEFTGTNNRSEILLASKNLAKHLPLDFVPAGTSLETLKHLKDLYLTAGLSTNDLVDAEFGFSNSDAAKTFNQRIVRDREEAKERIEKVRATFASDDSPEFDFMSSQMQQSIGAINSLVISRNDSAVRFVMPRPDDLEERVKDYFAARQRGMQQFRKFETVQEVSMAPIIVVAKPIDAGKIITADDLRQEQWPAQLAPDDSFADAPSVVGKRASHKMFQGMPILQRDVK